MEAIASKLGREPPDSDSSSGWATHTQLYRLAGATREGTYRSEPPNPSDERNYAHAEVHTLLRFWNCRGSRVGTTACGDDNNPVDPGNGNGSNVVVLSGGISGNRTLSPDSVYVVRGFLQILPGATLTIPAGMEIFSEPATFGTIVTQRGSTGQPSGRLVVQGTQASPVIFLPGTVEDAENGSLSPAQ